ncbi:hypothetical protein [Actinokineospora sp.]|uniref:hypothetical protein n=1 Tax=Actinokineospora sp. TaxID=1872133 RepID=UPI0040384BBE
MTEWLTIGVMARRGGLTAKALRAVDLPLDDVRTCLADPEAMAGVLAAHRRRLAARLTRVQGDLHHLDHLRTGGADMPDEPDERGLAATLFNEVWRLLEQENRTPADDDRMVHMAHASRYHWDNVGTPVNLVRGEWQCSRVYATLGRAEPALWHARRAHELCEQHAIGDFDLAFCYEALARAHAVACDLDAARAWAERALAVPVADVEDRELVLHDLASIPR